LAAALLLGSLALVPASAAEAVISSVEVTQVMGKGVDLDSGKFYFMNTFVAEKPTSIQVVLAEMTDITSAFLSISYEGSHLATVTPKESGRRQLLTFTPAKNAVNGWRPGRYSFTATINGVSKTTEAIFNASRSFSVLIISASVKHGGKAYPAPDLTAATIPLRSQALPVSESRLKAKYRNAKIAFGTGAEGYDIGEPGGAMRLLSDIESYRTKSAQNYDVVVAAVNAPLNDNDRQGGGNTTGYTNCNHAAVLTLGHKPTAEALEATLLHELGHILGNGDEYTGGSFSVNVNGAPYGVSGRENGQSVTGQREYFCCVEGNNYSGITIAEAQNPYNPKADVPMLGRSSFMGSSHRHWPTSMVWEEAYRHLIPNYLNVLPRVYTDGSIVAARPADDELSNKDREALIAEFRKMLGEVRAAKGYAPYKNDNILASGQKHLHSLALDIMARRDFAKQTSLDPVLNAIKADTHSHIGQMAMTSALYEYDGLQYWRDFFTQSPCGDGWISEDYFFVDFVKCDGTVYFMYTTISNVTPLPDEEEPLEPQPESLPVPTINPVNDEPIDPGKFADRGYEEPPTTRAATTTTKTTTTTTTTTTAPQSTITRSQSTTTAAPRPGQSVGTPAYADLTKAQRVRLMNYDIFDFGIMESSRDLDAYPFPKDYVYGFYAWYANDRYGMNITANGAKIAIDKFDAMGEGETARFDLVCAEYGLYPPQELREHEYAGLSVLYPQWRYGRTPKRSRLDTDRIDPDYGKKINDADINDPDGGW